MSHKPLLSIVAPFYNEEAMVPVFYESITSVLARWPRYDFEIICVDDGSRDDTLPYLHDLAQQDPRLRVIELSRNFGKEAALTAGIDFATGIAAIPIDSDLQDPPELIGDLIKAWEAGADVVLARRSDRHYDSALKRISANFFYAFHNRVSHTRIPHNVGDFRLMNRAAVDALKALPERQRFMKGLFAWIGFKTAIVDYSRMPRARGQTKFSGWKLWNFAIEAITSFSIAPLRIWTYVGIVCAIFTLFYAVFIITRVLLYGIDSPGYASLLVVVLFFGSLQLISIGIFGEYLGRIYMETKQRPTYIVRSVHQSQPKGSP